MPADAVAGLFEGIIALFQALIELTLLAIELAVELVFLIGELIAWLFFKRRERYARPAWIQARREQKKSALAKLLLIAIAALVWAGFHYGRTEIHFGQNGFRRPDQVEVILSKGDRTKTAMIEKGKLTVLRGRWDRLEIRDPAYVPVTREISGRKVHVWLDRVPTAASVVTDAIVAEGMNRLIGAVVEAKEKKEAEKKKEADKK